jgi:DDE domain
MRGPAYEPLPQVKPCRDDRLSSSTPYVKVSGRWVCLYRAIDQYGQVIDVLVSSKRDLVVPTADDVRSHMRNRPLMAAIIINHNSGPRILSGVADRFQPRAVVELIEESIRRG